MSRSALTTLLLLVCVVANASGPIAPKGWSGSFEATLPNGQPCCISADLNGTGLVGGAVVNISTNRKEFGLFALYYLPGLKERWQLLERHPVAVLENFRFRVIPPGEYRHGAIEACFIPKSCIYYSASSANSGFKRVARKAG